ncbi:MAG: hypothetical protein KIS94_03380 [Chitinophagales bacterium]|nr:hypothetical protein [Chitinophagales bacterium]
MKAFSVLFFTALVLWLPAQKQVYDIFLFGNKIGQTIVERKDNGNGTVKYTLNSKSEANVIFTKKTSEMNYDIIYENGQLLSAYTKNMKDGVTEISKTIWQGTKYLIQKGAEMLHLDKPIDFSSIQLYFSEPKGRTVIFSERLGEYCTFKQTSPGVYECKLANGVSNIYRYKDGALYELEMSKGASVYLRPAK